MPWPVSKEPDSHNCKPSVCVCARARARALQPDSFRSISSLICIELVIIFHVTVWTNRILFKNSWTRYLSYVRSINKDRCFFVVVCGSCNVILGQRYKLRSWITWVKYLVDRIKHSNRWVLKNLLENQFALIISLILMSITNWLRVYSACDMHVDILILIEHVLPFASMHVNCVFVCVCSHTLTRARSRSDWLILYTYIDTTSPVYS